MKHFVFVLFIFLAACESSNTVINPVLQDRPRIPLQEIRPTTQLPVEWIVITQDNVNQQIETLRSRNRTLTLFSLTPQDYENLSINTAELRRYIQQQTVIINALREYYEATRNNDNRPRVPNQ
jgi:hypothetical protein